MLYAETNTRDISLECKSESEGRSLTLTSAGECSHLSDMSIKFTPLPSSCSSDGSRGRDSRIDQIHRTIYLIL